MNSTFHTSTEKGKLEIPRMQNLLKEWEKFLDKYVNSSRLLEEVKQKEN